MWQEKLDDDIFLIPVRLEDCLVPDALSRFQWVDIFTERGVQVLIKTLISRSAAMGFTVNRARQPAPTPVDRMREYLDAVNHYGRARLVIEGINTTDLASQIQHGYGLDYYKDVLVPEGRRCVYFLEYSSWQGTSGSEDVSDLVIDFLIFDRDNFESAVRHCSGHPGSAYRLRGERVRDDGFWEDGMPSFRYTHLENIPIELIADLSSNEFRINHDSEITRALHPAKFYVSDEAVVF
jgi:hypothetical protein